VRVSHFYQVTHFVVICFETYFVVSSRGFNRQSVQEAIKKIQGKLSLFKVLPPNGLVVFCGHPDETKLILLTLEPLKPISQTLYKCDNKFHTEVLRDQLTIGDSKIGFVVMYVFTFFFCLVFFLFLCFFVFVLVFWSHSQ
jgi:hypothetical protein